MYLSADAMGSCPPEIDMSLKRGLFTRGLGMRAVVQPPHRLWVPAPAPAGNNVEFHNLFVPRFNVGGHHETLGIFGAVEKGTLQPCHRSSKVTYTVLHRLVTHDLGDLS